MFNSCLFLCQRNLCLRDKKPDLQDAHSSIGNYVGFTDGPCPKMHFFAKDPPIGVVLKKEYYGKILKYGI